MESTNRDFGVGLVAMKERKEDGEVWFERVRMWHYFFRDYATHYEAFPDEDYNAPLDDSSHVMHETHVSIKKGDWFSIHVNGNSVHLLVNGMDVGEIINDSRIWIGDVYPVITFGSADGDKIGLLPVDREIDHPTPAKGKENTSPKKESAKKESA